MNQQDLIKLQKLLLKIPKRKVTTYGRLAKAMNQPRSPRYIGYLLKNNPKPDKYPCYKVVKSNGGIGGYSGTGGVKEKIRRLRTDGIIINSGRVKDFSISVFDKF
jgi:O-6-methylguanine DNA methyltransferase